MALKLSAFDKKSASFSKSKCKNLLVSVLSPRALGRKKTLPNVASTQKADTISIEAKCHSPQSSTDNQDPGYATVQDMQLKDTQQASQTQSPTLKTISTLNQDSDDDESCSELASTLCEPVYATVSKKKDKEIAPKIHGKVFIDQKPELQSRKSIHFEELNQNAGETEKSTKQISQVKLSQHEQSKNEKIRILQNRLKDVSEENRNIKKHLQNLMNEEKRKEDSIHAKLHLKLTELEAETHKDVKCLTERIQIIAKEREILAGQVQNLYHEKKTAQAKFDALSKKIETMISIEDHRKAIEEQKGIIEELNLRSKKEKLKLQENYSELDEINNSLKIQIQELQEKKTLLEAKNEKFKLSEQELLQEKNRILLQLEDSKNTESEAYNLVQSLLKTAENMVTERDVLLHKASFQDQLQKQIQTTIVGYSLNIGRLQEHIRVLNQEKLEELKKQKIEEPQHVENIKKTYQQQLDLLHSKVLNQNNIIRELENDKRKLELQLESIWQTVCVDKPKFMDQVNNLNF